MAKNTSEKPAFAGLEGAEVAEVYNVYLHNEWGDELDLYYEDETAAKERFASIVDSFCTRTGDFSEDCSELDAGDCENYYTAKKASPDLPPWHELARKAGHFWAYRMVSDICGHCEKVRVLRLPNGEVYRLDRVEVRK